MNYVAMKYVAVLLAGLSMLFSNALFAADEVEDQSAAQTVNSDAAGAKKLPPVTSSDKNHNGNSLSSTLERGMDNKGLTMQEKWSDDMIVCKRQSVSGSRLTRKVCHSRHEWRAMRENGRELTREIQRRDAGEQ